MASLDDAWESSLVERLPFPLAFHLKCLRRDDYPWDFLLKDTLHMVLKYLAVVAAADYLQSHGEPDYDINEQLQNFRINMSEGHWLRLLRTCCASDGTRIIGEMNELFEVTEKGDFQARISWPETNLRSHNAGILSLLVMIRNKMLGHGKSPSEEDKLLVKPRIVGLHRVVWHLFEPIWKYDLVYHFDRKPDAGPYVLRGTSGFPKPDLPVQAPLSKCFLWCGDRSLNLYPLFLSDKPRIASQITLIDLDSEQYILEHIDSRFKPEYVGVGGAVYKPGHPDDRLQAMLEKKRVWSKRQDVELEEVLGKLRRKTTEALEDIENNNIYKPGSYFHRKGPEEQFSAFVDDRDSRALIVSGSSGCGKTTSVVHFIRTLLSAGKHVMLIRALELPERIQKPKEFARWITEYVGYGGDFADILQYLDSTGTDKLILVVDGLNEFTARGRDASRLFSNINHFLADHRHSGTLKMLITFRSDSLSFFLPGNRLPVDVIEEAYYRPGGKDFYEIGTLSEQEGLKMLKTLKIATGEATEIIAMLAPSLRTPLVLYKIAGGAIAPGDLKGMASWTITTRFLGRRLGRDKELRKLCTELMAAMGKSRDMNLTEEQLEKNNPRLLSKLKAGNNRLLNVLSDLEIIQQIRTEDKSGNPTSAILLAHDTIFEGLEKAAKRVAQRRILYLLPVMVPIFVLYFGWFFSSLMKDTRQGLQPEEKDKIEQVVREGEMALMGPIPGETGIRLSPDEQENLQDNRTRLLELYRYALTEFKTLQIRANAKAVMIIYSCAFALIIPGIIVAYFLSKIDKREARIKFFGAQSMKKRQKPTLWLHLIFFISMFTMILVGFLMPRVSNPLIASIALMSVFVFHFLILTPAVNTWITLRQCRQSQMVAEYHLSQYGMWLFRRQQLVGVLGGSLLFFQMFGWQFVPSRLFFPEHATEKIRAGITLRSASIDFSLFDEYAMKDKNGLGDFIKTRGHSLDSRYGRSVASKAWEEMTGQKREMGLEALWMLLIVIAAINLLFSVVHYVPYEIASRRYRKSTG